MSVDEQQQRTKAPDGRPDSVQPAWRRDFPIDMAEDNFVARRDFTKYLGLTSLAFVAGQLWIVFENWLRRSQGQPLVVPIAKLGDIPVGRSLIFAYPDKSEPCLLVRTSEDSFHAYNQKCTHLSCDVVPMMDQSRFHCPCHEGSFDMTTGRPLAGPPRRPLTRITLEIRDGVVYATGVELRSI